MTEREGAAAAKAIAVELDDVLDDFSASLRAQGIVYDPGRHSLRDPLLRRCLYDWQTGELSGEARRAMRGARPAPGGAEFLEWLRTGGWETAVFTRRDLRFAWGETARWLEANGMPCRPLFAADELEPFCRDMGIRFVVSRTPQLSARFTCFVPAAGAGAGGRYAGANIRLYQSFQEVETCLQGL